MHSSDSPDSSVSRLVRSLALLGSLLLASCGRNDYAHLPMTTALATIVSEGADRAQLDIEMAGGGLLIAGGTAAPDQLLQAEFLFDAEPMRPVVEYAVEPPPTAPGPSVGRLHIHQPGYFPRIGRTRNDWRLLVSDQIPTSLDIRLGIGNLALRASELNLGELKVHVNQGEVRLDLGEMPVRDLTATVEVANFGRIVVRLPEGDVGLRVRGRKAVGSLEVIGLEETDEGWQNRRFGEAAVDIDLALGIGTGEIIVEIGGEGPDWSD